LEPPPTVTNSHHQSDQSREQARAVAGDSGLGTDEPWDRGPVGPADFISAATPTRAARGASGCRGLGLGTDEPRDRGPVSPADFISAASDQNREQARAVIVGHQL